MKRIFISLAAFMALVLAGCQEQLRSSDYYREHIDEAQQTEKKCKQLRADGKEPDDVLAKNCRLAHDVLFRQATGSTAAGIKNSP